ncbi:hypothetical protein MNBD_GAMMA08-106 [hydrothermal vent metagenome]|uniref:DUF3301 domain-containing protein n=1 Tax=hydrothermal vent metagenome TaxID=652676 RepID=A0A3B0X777_9ZZZZ
MYFTQLFIIMGLVLLIWFWLDSMKINETARRVGAKICKKNNVQFLDETVHLSSMRFGKNSYGQLKLLRKYKFEFTNSEFHRYNGELILAGHQLQTSQMDAYRLNEVE